MADYTQDFGKGSSWGTPAIITAVPMAAAKIAYGRCLVFVNSSGYASGLSSDVAAGSFCPGVASKLTDNSTGSAGALYVDVEDLAFLDNDSTNAITQAMCMRQLCYAVNNHTVGSSDVGGTLVPCGVPLFIDSRTGRVAVSFNAALVLAVMGSSSGAYEAQAVATNLAALTFTSGTFSADANGALAAQDGQTLAVGDVVLIPEGTITTGTVTAANSGPYVLTSIGSASTKVTGVRPSWYAHGSAIPSQSIRVRKGTLFAGTRWIPFAMGTIGSTDPLLRPDKVTQKVTLVSSAKAITNVPMLSATRTNVLCALAGVGGTTTSTVGYGIIVAPTPGGIGTATVTVNAIASGGTKNGTSDTSDVLVTIING